MEPEPAAERSGELAEHRPVEHRLRVARPAVERLQLAPPRPRMEAAVRGRPLAADSGVLAVQLSECAGKADEDGGAQRADILEQLSL